MKVSNTAKLLALAGFCITAGSVVAADQTLNEDQLYVLLVGNTVFIKVPAGTPGNPNGGIIPFKYGADGSVAVRLSAQLTLVGTWKITGNKYCGNWNNGPKNSCSQYVKMTEGYNIVDFSKKQIRGTVMKIVPGNPEAL